MTTHSEPHPGRSVTAMQQAIRQHGTDPHQLEALYRQHKVQFEKAFPAVFPELEDRSLALAWQERLNYEHAGISLGSGAEMLFILVASFLAGLIAKIPAFTDISEDHFYPRHMGFIVFPLLSAYFAWKQELPMKRLLPLVAAFGLSLLYINVLPGGDLETDTLILACIHLPLFLWSMTGLAFVGDEPLNLRKRLEFLRYNGDLVVMTTIILIAGALLTGITLGLFSLIDINIAEFYFEYIVVWGVAAAPVVGTYLVQTNPQLVDKVSPIIARIFTPLVLVTLVAYLIAVISSGKDPYNDRDFLLLFNMLLIGVMAIILFSVAGTLKNTRSRISTVLLSFLSIVTILVNSVALSAILFRISTWGITPNRLAVLGGNLLILGHLLIVSWRLFGAVKDPERTVDVENIIAAYMPVYIAWSFIVTFVFPVAFGFK